MRGKGIIPNCQGQMTLVCHECDGQRVIKSDDTPDEICIECGGSGIAIGEAETTLAVHLAYMALRRFTPPS